MLFSIYVQLNKIIHKKEKKKKKSDEKREPRLSEPDPKPQILGWTGWTPESMAGCLYNLA
jgi:hypothetical protein